MPQRSDGSCQDGSCQDGAGASEWGPAGPGRAGRGVVMRVMSCEPLREARDEPRRVKESAYFVIVLKAIR